MTDGKDSINVVLSENGVPYTTGLSKREYFAATILQGMYSNRGLVDQWDCEDILSLNAVKAADALIEALNKYK